MGSTCSGSILSSILVLMTVVALMNPCFHEMSEDFHQMSEDRKSPLAVIHRVFSTYGAVFFTSRLTSTSNLRLLAPGRIPPDPGERPGAVITPMLTIFGPYLAHTIWEEDMYRPPVPGACKIVLIMYYLG